ncbi:hypothetical protein ACXZ1K_11440 [Pedobacter sp. PWIIR3]
MKVYKAIIIASIALLSCNTESNDGIPVANDKKSNQGKEPTKTGNSMVFSIHEGVAVDGSSYILYPLGISSLKDEGDMKRYSSDSEAENYWNIAFYNLETGASKLLDSNRALLITNFERRKDFILYKVTTTDFNGDGKLGYNDPAYLFVSDLSGARFRQISPNNAHVVSWTFTNPSGVMLIQTVLDSNKDKKFGSGDQSVPMIYNPLLDQTARETFSKAFTDKVNNEFGKLYQDK